MMLIAQILLALEYMLCMECIYQVLGLLGIQGYFIAERYCQRGENA